MITLDPLGLSLLRQLCEADEDVRAIQSLPLEIRKGIAFMDGFARLGIRDQIVREIADHFVMIPCQGIETKEYQAATWPRKDEYAHMIVNKAMALYRESEG